MINQTHTVPSSVLKIVPPAAINRYAMPFVLNEYGETLIDVMIGAPKPYDELSGPMLDVYNAYLKPGLYPGQRLFLRYLEGPTQDGLEASGIGYSSERLYLWALKPGGWNGASGLSGGHSFEGLYGVTYETYMFGGFHDKVTGTRLFPKGVTAFVDFLWTGTAWCVLAASHP